MCWIPPSRAWIWLAACLLLFLQIEPSRPFSKNKVPIPSTRRQSKPVFPPSVCDVDSSEFISSCCIVVDFENVRGKAEFQLSHDILTARSMAWYSHHEGQTNHSLCCLALVIDHGALQCVLSDGPLLPQVHALFAGPGVKADDVIVRLVEERCSSADGHCAETRRNTTVVITADSELISRCQRARRVPSRLSQVVYIHPITFLAELEAFQDADPLCRPPSSVVRSDDGPTTDADGTTTETVDAIRREMKARQEVVAMDRQLRNRFKGISRKQRTKLMKRHAKAKARLLNTMAASASRGAPTIKSLVNGHDTSGLEDVTDVLVLESLQRMQSSRRSPETTYERHILAERFRRLLLEAHGAIVENRIHPLNWAECTSQSKNQTDLDTEGQSRRTIGVFTVPGRRHTASETESNATTSLRIVAISDTHGLINDFARLDGSSGPYRLPTPADVLIHCGDFSSHKGISDGRKLDAFLAAQTEIPHKIVIRGNHDPRAPGKVLFPRSKALYATEISIVKINNTDFCFMPFTYKRPPYQVPACDVLVSHEPPFGVLDATYRGAHVGSLLLRKAVENAAVKPRLWLCGHIHEGRGAARVQFGSNPKHESALETLVLNVANANPGRATKLVASPTLVDVVQDDEKETLKTIRGAPSLLREDSLEALAAKEANSDSAGRRKQLLAVDLGLRTATAVFDAKGQFVQVRTWNFENLDALKHELPNMLHNVTHVVLEGMDQTNVYKLWVDAISSHQSFAVIRAEDWRRALLLPKESRNGQQAKAAARLIARQIVGAGFSSIGSTDAAEAILTGYHAVRVLGWRNDSPPVRRYTNGNIVV